jgi:RHS repeat-associated protein
LPSQVTVTAPDLVAALSPTRSTSFTYTKDGVASAVDGYFVLTTKNALNQTTTTTHDPRDGQILKTTDPNGVQVVETHDPFGRTIEIDHLGSTNQPFASPVQIAYASCRNAAGAFGQCPNGPGHDANETHASYEVTTTQTGYPTKATWFDDLNRPVKTAERGFAGTYNATLTDYALNGEIDEESTPYVVGSTAPYFTAYAYDALKRPTQAMRHVDVGGNGYVQTDYTYSGRKTTTTVHDKAVVLSPIGACPTNTSLCLQTSRATNVLGEQMQLVESPVLNGAATTLTTNYWTEPNGHVVAITDPDGALTTASYNALGQRTGSHDPDQGSWTFTYDALGELLNQSDARGVVTTVTKRDALGRTTEQQVVPPAALPTGLANETVVDRWTFDPVSGVGELGQAQRLRGPNRATPTANPEVWKEVYGYESTTARPSAITTTISEGAVQTLQTSMDYNANGRPDTRTYPSANGSNRLRVRTGYNSNGHLASLSNADTNAIYWLATAENAWGHVTNESWLNGALTGMHGDYESTGQAKLKSWFGGGASDQFDYVYDRLGNLKSQTRSAAGANASENYTYDALQRLIARSGSGGSASYAYTKSGNLTQKTDFGLGANAYVYPAGKHGVTSVALPENQTATYSYDANGNLVGGNTINATYDGSNKLRTITRAYLLSGAGDKIFCNGFDDNTNHCKNPPGGGTTTWTYGTNGERSTEQSTQGLRFFGPDGYELIAATGASKHELGPVLITRIGASDTITIELKDRLGSTVDTITGASATLRTYDPFGAARNGNMVARHNGTLNLGDTIHGFTGHTHADDVGLIHMLGRVFDPNLGRFLSVDPVVDSDAGSQGLNPYSYIRNNPLSGTDPTGNCSTGTHITGSSGPSCGSLGVNTTIVNAPSTQAGTSAQPHDSQGTTGPTSQPKDANKQAADIRDGSRTSKQLAQVEPTEERERRDETNGPSAEAYRERGIAPALAPAVEGNAEREAKEIERTIQQGDPSYRIPNTKSGLGDDNPIDRLDAAREELEARQAKFFLEVLPQGTRPLPGTRTIPEGIPENWRIRSSKTPGGVKYYDPQNPGNQVRVEQGNPNSSYSHSQQPYVRELRNGQYHDVQGNVVPREDPRGHIPLDQYSEYQP